MGIQVNIRRRFTVNGKEYGSTGEMPADVREAFDKAMAGGIRIQTQKTRIVFNGREYAGLEAMPPEIRLSYEKLLQAAEAGAVPADLVASEYGAHPSGSAGSTVSRAGAAVRFEPSFSSRKALAAIALIAAIILLYLLLRGK